MHTKLTEGINSVGVVDWNIRDFHGYETRRGSTYNVYLVEGEEKTALIDTVKHSFTDTLLANIDALSGLDAVDYVVANHAELDHSGALAEVLEATGATLVTNEKAVETLSAYYDTSDWDIQVIENGESLDLGGRSLTFVRTPMVHWPESMVTYCPEDEILFSNDAFGQHFASSGRFDDENDLAEVMEEAKTYYANIVMLYGRPIAKAMGALADLDIAMIAPAHGVVWRSHISTILDAYSDWVECKPRAKVLVIYESMWHSTDRMAHEIARGATREGVEVKLFDVGLTHRTRLATEVLDAAAIAFGSPTLNMTLMPEIAGALTYLKGLAPKGKAGFAFGSYGWAPSGPNAVNEYIEDMKFEVLREPLTAQWKPDEDALAECREAGALLADSARQAAPDA